MEGEPSRGATLAGNPITLGGLGGMIPLLPVFSGDTSGIRITEFFDALADVNRVAAWTKAQMLAVARLKLTGIAREFARKDRRIKDVEDFEIFKKVMIERFERIPYTYRLQKFYACVQAREEDVQAYAVRLQSLAAEVEIEHEGVSDTEIAIIRRVKEKELDERLRVQFLSGIDMRIRQRVMSRDPETFDQALQVAIREESIELLTSRPRGVLKVIKEEEIPNESQERDRSRETSRPEMEQLIAAVRALRVDVNNLNNSNRNPAQRGRWNWQGNGQGQGQYPASPGRFPGQRGAYNPISQGKRRFAISGEREKYPVGSSRPRLNRAPIQQKPSPLHPTVPKQPTGRGQPRVRFAPAFGGTRKLKPTDDQEPYRPIDRYKGKIGSMPPKPKVNNKRRKEKWHYCLSNIIPWKKQDENHPTEIEKLRRIHNEPAVVGKIEDIPATLQVDTGAKVSLLSKTFLNQIPKRLPIDYTQETELRSATGHPIHTYGILSPIFQIGELCFPFPCCIVDDEVIYPCDGLIGRDMIVEKGFLPDLQQGRLIIPPHNIIPFISSPVSGRKVEYKVIRRKEDEEKEPDQVRLEVSREVTLGPDNLPKVTIKVDRIDEPDPLVENEEEGKEVILIETCKLPPRSDNIVTATIKGVKSKKEMGVIESHSLPIEGLSGAHLLVTPNKKGQVPVRLQNTTHNTIKLEKGTTVGTFWKALEENKPTQSLKEGGTSTLSKEEFSQLFKWDNMEETEKQALLKLLYKYRYIFALNDYDLGYCEIVKQEINTGDATPIYSPPYRIPYAQRQQLNEIVEGLLENNIIEHSTSPWSSPALLVRKRDGSFRLVIDYRKLNKITKVDPYPLPLVQESLSLMGKATYFSTMDTISGFWQLGVSDKEKTAFSTPDGHYQWNRMPMGLKTSPAIFERAMDFVLHGLKGKICLVYMDDILTFSSDFPSHLERLEQVFKRLASAGIKLKPRKCHFLRKQIKFLGHEISEEGIKPDPDKIQCVINFPQPVNEKDIRAFLGLTGYYRRHIDSYAKIAKPLTNLLKKDSVFEWGPAQQGSFEQLKEIITSAPLLKSPDFQEPFILATDASNIALGAVLSQKENGQEKPIAYASRLLRKPEINYSATEKECLATVWAVKHFKPYLYGRKFILVTDHRPLRWLLSNKDSSTNSRLSRWIISLQEFDFEVIHKAGNSHQNADALSRIPIRQIQEVEPIYSNQQIKTLQGKDSKLNAIIQALKAGQTSGRISNLELEEFFLNKEEILCHKNPQEERGQIVVPDDLKDTILYSYHDNPIAGHLSDTKMIAKIEKIFYWPDMKKEIKKYCHSCQSCAQHRRPGRKSQAELQLFSPLTHLFERTAMDIIGPLPITTNGNKYILVFIDHFSRYAEAVPLPDISSKTIAKAFVTNIILRHSTPVQLLTDRAPNLISKLFSEVCDILKIKRLLTTAYHPACNGIVERFNKTLIDILSHYVSKDQRDWDEWIPYALFAYNTSIHASTNESPFYMLYGRDPTYPFELLTNPATTSYDVDDNYAAELRLRMQETHQTAKEFSEVAAKLRQERHRKQNKPPSYQVGDRVLLKEVVVPRGIKRKLAARWSGPYRIIAILGPVNFEIENIKTKRKINVHANRIKPSIAREEIKLPVTSLDLPLPKEAVSEEEDTQIITDPWDELILNASILPHISPVPEEGSEEEEETELTEDEEIPEDEPSPPYALRSQGPVEEFPWVMPVAHRSRSRIPRFISPSTSRASSP